MQATDTGPRIAVFDDPEQVARAAAQLFVELAKEGVSGRGKFTVALAGGSTPRRIYELLASDEFRDQVSWSEVHIYFGDERTVPPDHSDSNFRMANEALISKVPIPPINVHSISGVGDAAANASLYESNMRELFGESAWPRLDLVMLGMGDDGHTASLFPESEALIETAAWVVRNWVEKFGTWRITLSAPAINNARNILFTVTGSGKSDRLNEVLRGPYDPTRLPSQLIQPVAGSLQWFVDKAAAAKL